MASPGLARARGFFVRAVGGIAPRCERIAVLFRRLGLAVPAALAALLGGCWTAPRADIRPQHEPGVIGSGIVVVSERDRQRVQRLDGTTGMLVVSGPEAGAPRAYRLASGVPLRHIAVGDRVRLRLAEELTVFVPGSDSPAEQPGDEDRARVLYVDRSYRVLTLRYPTGLTEPVKVGVGVAIKEMEPGDSVSIRPIEVIWVRRE